MPEIPDLRIPGRETNNPLVVLNNHLGSITSVLMRIAAAQEHDLGHVYALAEAKLPMHGAVWGAYCMACSGLEGSYVYPCRQRVDEVVKPPQFFTIGRAFEARADGGFLVHEPPD